MDKSDKSFAMISLGCAKNLVNSEQMLYLMSEAGYALVPDPDGADLLDGNLRRVCSLYP